MTADESTIAMFQRREFMRNGLRCGGLLALGGLAAALGWRTLHSRCPRTDPCSGCPLLSECGLPKALDAKNRNAADTNRGTAKPGSSHA